MIPILPSASLSKDRGNRPSVKFILGLVAGMTIWLCGYAVGYREAFEKGEIHALKKVAKIMAGALDKSANK